MINQSSMYEHLIVSPGYLDSFIGKEASFVELETRRGTTEYRDGTDFQRLPVQSYKQILHQVRIETIQYEIKFGIFTINGIHTREFSIK